MTPAPTAETTTEAVAWTCARCEVTSRWMAGHDCGGIIPPNWAENDGLFYCLGCRRERAAEAALDALPPETKGEDRAKARNLAKIIFEIRRAPTRTNGEIARAARCSPLAVVKARKGLEGE